MTQILPFLLPLRVAQKKFCFYTKMFFDSNQYARTKDSKPLQYCIFEAKTQLINKNTGFDMQYQKNKVFNLEIASKPVNGILMCPGETFSFWQLVRYAEKSERYKEGLSLQDGKLVTVPGGGLCHLSNFLFWLFLHAPLTMVERHPHKIKDFPSPDENEPDGVDATINEGWLDLKVKNNTAITFQVLLNFEETVLNGRIQADYPGKTQFYVLNRNKIFYKKHGKVYEKVGIYRQKLDLETNKIFADEFLYTDEFEIGYVLPADTIVSESKMN